MSSPLGEDNLHTLLASLEPQLDPAVYVFCTLPLGATLPSTLKPLCQFQEAEGLTLILTQASADQAGLEAVYPCRRITLTVHSNLAAIGLLATVTQALAARDISVNAVSAFYHDHLFVPCDRAHEAMACLRSLMPSVE